MEKRYIKLSDYADMKSITYTTAWTHYKKGLIKDAYKDESGHVLVPINSTVDYSQAVLYSRVSSNEMKENLVRQEERLIEYATKYKYQIVKSVKEIGSGMNDNRKKLNLLLKDDTWTTLIVENKDRLTRFGFNYLQTLLEKSGKRIVVINESDNNVEMLMEDLISIIYSFSARMYGLRRQKTKEEIKQFIES